MKRRKYKSRRWKRWHYSDNFSEIRLRLWYDRGKKDRDADVGKNVKRLQPQARSRCRENQFLHSAKCNQSPIVLIPFCELAQ